MTGIDPGSLNSWAPAILAPHPTLNAGRSPLLPTTTTSGRRGIEAPNSSLPRLLQSGLTPKLSGAPQHSKRHLVHGASARTIVRMPWHSNNATRRVTEQEVWHQARARSEGNGQNGRCQRSLRQRSRSSNAWHHTASCTISYRRIKLILPPP